jgi:hypothetical protein
MSEERINKFAENRYFKEKARGHFREFNKSKNFWEYQMTHDGKDYAETFKQRKSIGGHVGKRKI